MRLAAALARRAAPPIARALLAADVVAILGQLWALTHRDAAILHGMLALIASLADSGKHTLLCT